MTPPVSERRLMLLLPPVLASLGMLGPFSIDTPFPAFAQMRDEFAVGAEPMQLVVSVYLVAFALMSIFHGPLSDAVGRKPVMTAGLVGYAIGSVGCALAPSLPVLLAFRAVQGVCAGGSVIVSRTIVRDVYSGPQAQRLMSTVAMIFGLAPAVAPVIGGLLLQLGPWPLIFWFLVAWSVAMVLLVAIVLPETHPPERRTEFRPGPLLASLLAVARSSTFHRVAWTTACLFGAQFLYIGSAAIIVVDLLGQGETDFWKLFVPLIGGMVIGTWLSRTAAGRISVERLITLGVTGALVMAVVNLGITMLPGGDLLPWAAVGPALLACGVGSVFPALQLRVLDLFPTSRGAAASGAMFLSLVLNAVTAAALAPLVTTSMQRLAVAALALELLALTFWVWHLRRDVRPGLSRPTPPAAPSSSSSSSTS